ncbi:protein kinase activator [Niveomyces insectorum RCEF 264]|uniref:Protein kinase activator n=1 Tax=Niveomyces insectorum RCEF 264 TaxID=1081102 RepID=A0A167VNA1_9HYPO|nr:protein kinase activator [Niveomyces insectorum RCEF 264]
MSTLFSGINARLRGGTSKAGGASKSPTTPTTPTTDAAPSPLPNLGVQTRQSSEALSSTAPGTATSASAPTLPRISPSSSTNMMSSASDRSPNADAAPLPLWLNPAYAKHIVKGNFMTLSARPKSIEPGEWIAHQVVEHYRLLWNFVRLVYEKEKDGSSICNVTSCPKMSAGRNHSYTWLNNRLEPIELPAREYMSLMQRWISGKIDDPTIFPTDPATVSFASNPALAAGNAAATATPAPFQLVVAGGDGSGEDWVGKNSGFPKEFVNVCRTVFLQMFRVYAHLYWDHFVEPFYHLNLEKQLNSCFSHFILTATTLNMLRPEDIEPMQLLVDLWAANGTFPPESKAYSLANVESGKRLMMQG